MALAIQSGEVLMAGAGGTGRPPSNPDFLRQMADKIMEELNRAQPQAPMAPSPQPLSPASAYAAARNPATLPYFSEMANAPGQMQYKAAQSAFEEAMQGRRNALSAGVSLANAQQRTTNRTLRLVPRNVVRGGVNLGITEIFDPITGEKLGESEAGELAYAPTIGEGVNPDTGKPTIYRYPKNTGGTAFPVQGAGGQDIQAPAPANAAGGISEIANVVKLGESIMNSPQVSKGGTLEFLGRLGQETVRKLPGIGPQASSKISSDKEAFMADLDYFRSRMQLIITGKVANLQEQSRLMRMIPEASTATNPAFFRGQMQKFINEFKATLRREASQRPSLFTQEELDSLAGGGDDKEEMKRRILQRHGVGLANP